MDLSYLNCDNIIYPEGELLKYLEWLTNILKSNQNWDVDTLCQNIKQLDLEEKELSSSENAVILENKEVKSILLNDIAMKENLVICVQVLLEFVKNKIENFDKTYYTEIMTFMSAICGFVEACELNKIILAPLKIHVTNFLFNLLSTLGTADSVNFLTKGPVYQPIAQIIGSFKNIEFARSYILIEISKRLQSVYKLMLNTSTNKFDLGYNEILLLYLMVLKDILKYDVLNSLLKISKVNEREEKVLKDIYGILTNFAGKLPDYVEYSIQECLNLLY